MWGLFDYITLFILHFNRGEMLYKWNEQLDICKDDLWSLFLLFYIIFVLKVKQWLNTAMHTNKSYNIKT